jgi:hypothetical protein
VDVPGGVAVDAGVHGVTGCSGSGEDLVATEVMVGERGTEVDGGSGTGVDMLGERELPTPSSLEVDVLDGEVVIHQSRAVIHWFVPCPSPPFVKYYVACRAHTLYPWVKNVVGLQALRVADEHPWSAPVVELVDVAKLLDEREAAKDP